MTSGVRILAAGKENFYFLFESKAQKKGFKIKTKE